MAFAHPTCHAHNTDSISSPSASRVGPPSTHKSRRRLVHAATATATSPLVAARHPSPIEPPPSPATDGPISCNSPAIHLQCLKLRHVLDPENSARSHTLSSRSSAAVLIHPAKRQKRSSYLPTSTSKPLHPSTTLYSAAPPCQKPSSLSTSISTFTPTNSHVPALALALSLASYQLEIGRPRCPPPEPPSHGLRRRCAFISRPPHTISPRIINFSLLSLAALGTCCAVSLARLSLPQRASRLAQSSPFLLRRWLLSSSSLVSPFEAPRLARSAIPSVYPGHNRSRSASFLPTLAAILLDVDFCHGHGAP